MQDPDPKCRHFVISWHFMAFWHVCQKANCITKSAFSAFSRLFPPFRLFSSNPNRNVTRQKTNWLCLTLWLPSCYLAVIQCKKEIESAKTTLLSRNPEASNLSQHYGVTCKSKVKTINTIYFKEGGFVKSWTKLQIWVNQTSQELYTRKGLVFLHFLMLVAL